MITLQLALLLLAIALIGATVGYAAGRRRGYADGLRVGHAETPLLLREQALVSGACPLCGGQADTRTLGDRTANSGAALL